MCKLLKRLVIIISFIVVSVLFIKISNTSQEVAVFSEYSPIIINEVCSNNYSTAPIEGRENSDWIELYNRSEKAVNLKGWTISDDESNLKKFELPEITLASGAYYLLYATGDGIVEEDIVYLNYKLSEGENIYLCDSQENVMDCVAIPSIMENTGYARATDASADWINVVPTPGNTNDGAVEISTVEVPVPQFSVESGFYTGSLLLELMIAEGYDIYYTLDGSEPTVDSMLYLDPILIENRSYEENNLSARYDLSTEESYRYAPEVSVDKITVVRAIAVDSDGNVSDVVTNSYVMDIQQKETYQDLAILSLTADPDELFGDEGIYPLGLEYLLFVNDNGYIIESGSPLPNYLKRGRESEIPACIEVFDASGNLLLNQDVGIRIRGGTTRYMSQKSFSIFSREMYSGTPTFTADVFGNDYVYDKLVLFSDRDTPKIRHELNSVLLEDRAVETPEYMRCNVFIDGEYWGLYSLYEGYTEEYIENRYGVPAEEVVLYQGLWPEELYKNPLDLSQEELYQSIVEKIDMASLIDYYASMIYIDHYDWLGYNGYMWKSSTISEGNPYHDGKWRWMIYDTEISEKHPERNTFVEGNINTWQDDPIIEILMTDENFRKQFVNTFLDLANTSFEEEYVLQTIDTLFAGYSQAVEAQGIRWGGDWDDKVYSDLDMIKQFFVQRFDYITDYLKEEFELHGELVPLQIMSKATSAGSITVNTVTPAFEDECWTGYYFTDYPVELSVEEYEKGSFLGWYNQNGELVSKESKIEVKLGENNYYEAVFQ